MKQLLLLFLCGICPACRGGGGSWNYKSGDEHGPDHWPGECGGEGQSPINIITEETTKETDVEAFEFADYDQVPLRSVLINNGHSAKLSSEYLSKSMTPRVSGGGLGQSYRFGQVHFHWGDAASLGSEHTVDGAAFALEMHLVHFRDDLEDIGAAVAEGKQDSLAVLGFLFQESETAHPGLDQLLAHFPRIQSAGERLEVPSSALASLIPEQADLSSFWRYEGGLTTPTCNEIVEWTVFKQPLNVSAAQLDQFRSLLTHDGEALVNNFRPTQPLNDRRVRMVQTDSPRWCSVFSPSSALRISCPVTLLGVVSFVIFYQI